MVAKVSVLVPCYNVEKYLRECLDSIINQTLKDIEIICINDGSCDKTLEILQEYALRDKRIKLIDKENSGYGASMNRGLEAASGEYIGIIEPDDFVDKKMFSKLYEIAKERDADIVKSDFYYYTTKNKMARKAGNITAKKCGEVIDIKENNGILKLSPSIWSAIYKNKFLKTKNIRFLETPGASYQDTSFSYKVLLSAEKIVFTPKGYLYYRSDNENSSVKQRDKVFYICDEYREITRFLNEHKEIKKYVNSIKLINQFKAYKWNAERIAKKYRNDFIKQFQEEFIQYCNDNEITDDFYKKIKPKELKMLLEDKKAFRQYIDKIAFKDRQNEARQKKFSVRINSSRVSIVLFGKQILEIG